MGYGIHISRPRFWEGGPHKIGPDEWRNIVDTDPEFEASSELEDEPLYYWKPHPERPFFRYTANSGYVTVETLDEIILSKMLQIAEKLGAEIQGDEGEFYRLDSEGRIEKYW